MQALAEIVLSNAAIATGMALLAVAIGRFCRVPAVAHAMWLLVLLKLVTPPMLRVPLPLLPNGSSNESIAQLRGSQDSQPATLAGDTSLGSHSLSFNQEPLTAQSPAVSVVQPAGPTAMPKDRTGEAHPASDSADMRSSQLASLQTQNDSAARTTVPWSVLVLCIWGLGSATWVTIALLRLVRFRREIDRPWAVEAELQQRTNELAQRVGLRRAPAVKLVRAAIPPMLWAMCRPARILLPISLMARLSPHQTDALLVHELAHYRRRDHWVRWFELFVLGLYWWHPVAWIARRQLHSAEEAVLRCLGLTDLAQPGM